MTVQNLKIRIAWLAAVSVCISGVPAVGGGGGQEMRFMPIGQAPLGSPAGTIGDPVTPLFNTDRGCWEIETEPGVEIDLELQAFGWGNAAGNPRLGAIQGTLAGSSLENGGPAETNLNPKGWPATPMDGVYQPKSVCGPAGLGDGSPCVPPFDTTCANNGFCIPNPDWIMPACANDLAAIAVPNLDSIAWATAALNVCEDDDGMVKVLGGLILEVPAAASGTYTIAFDTDPNNSFMTSGTGAPIPGVLFTPACITVPCQSDADCDDDADCTTDTCNVISGTCENAIAVDRCLIDGVCFVNGAQDPEGPCRQCNAAVTQTAWSFRPTGVPCGPPGGTTCDGADTCDAEGECQDNVQPDGTPCDADANDCTDDVCESGVCTHPFSAAGTPCGDQNKSPCNGADSCDAAGNCLENVAADESPCPDGTFCNGAEECQAGVCEAGDPPCDSETEVCDEDTDRCDTLGDFDGDRMVTLADFLHWPDCETGPAGGPYIDGCEIFDFEPNEFVDLIDFARFQGAFDNP